LAREQQGRDLTRGTGDSRRKSREPPIEGHGCEPAAKPGRRQALQISAFEVFLLVLGAFFIVVGGHDAAFARSTVGMTAWSAVLLFVGILLMVAGWRLGRLCRHEPWVAGTRPVCHPIVLAAFVMTILLGLYLVFSGLGTATGLQRVVVVSFALVVVVVAVLGLLTFWRDVELTAPKVGAVALGLVGTTLGAWEFWYQNQYLPSRAGGTVQLNAQLRRIDQRGPFDVIKAALDYEAIGGKSVSVVGSAYTLTGSNVIACRRDATVARVRDYFKGFLLDPQKIRFMSDVVEQTPAVLAAGKFVADGKRLDPDVPANREFVFFVPHGRYQLLRFRAQVFAVPASVRLSQRKPPEYVRLEGDNELYGYWHVDDSSWLHDLVFGRERWLVMRYELVDPGDTTDRAKPADVVLAGQVLHVLARFAKPTWRVGRPNPKATMKLFDNPGAINSQEPRDASEPFADSELALERIDTKCDSGAATARSPRTFRRAPDGTVGRSP
jgi:hypothetical protein